MWVKWLDITSQGDPWIDMADAVAMKPAVMVSLGWIIREAPDFFTLASTLDTDPGDEVPVLRWCGDRLTTQNVAK